MATKGDVSGLDVLSFGGENLIPLISNYTGARRTGVVQSETNGGANRQRKKYYNTTFLYTAAFYLETPQQQDFFKMFFNRNEGKKFICHLAADRPIVEPYVVQVVSEWKDDYRNAKDGQVSMTLEIFSVRDDCLDEFLYIMYGCSGDDTACIIKGINSIAKSFL